MAVDQVEYFERMRSMQQEIAKLQQRLAELDQTVDDPRVRLVVFGLLNSGKSTLLNILTNHLDEELFKTGDFRVTTCNQQYETDDMIFVDTPGMDGGDSDDIWASLGVAGAHIILFLHNASHELEQQEIDLLKKMLQLEAGVPVNGKSPVMILMSRADSLSKDEVEQVHTKIMEQCQELLHTEFTVLPVSSMMFRRGMQENDPRKKNLFLEYSNIDKLKAMIEERCSQINPLVITLRMQAQETTHVMKKLQQVLLEFLMLGQILEEEDLEDMSDEYQHMLKVLPEVAEIFKDSADAINGLSLVREMLESEDFDDSLLYDYNDDNK